MTNEQQFTLDRTAAIRFAEKYQHITDEKQYGQSFWSDFFHDVAGIPNTDALGIAYEFRVGKNPETNRNLYADCFWAGVVLIEQKTAGKDIDRAEAQARNYVDLLPAATRPPFIIISDFQRFRVVNIATGETVDFGLADLPDHLHRFEGILNHYNPAVVTRVQIELNADAVGVMTDLYTAFVDAGYDGHDLSVFLIRVLFLNFGDDTGMWQRGLFGELVAETAEAGWTTGPALNEIFRVLNTPVTERLGDNPLFGFPYVNGGVFADDLPVFNFTAQMRSALIQTTSYDWSHISPAIFGAMFQTVKDKVERRKLGEHYTSEENIFKLINPLFLDELNAELSMVEHSVSGLRAFRKRLGNQQFLDPAAGSGNFLIVAYRELRRLEHKVVVRLRELLSREDEPLSDAEAGDVQVSLPQFHAIEVNEWSSQIATMAMYITKHQLNRELERLKVTVPNLFPLTTGAVVVHDNALSVDWAEVCPMGDDTVIVGNPPFIGGSRLTVEQKQDMTRVFGAIPALNRLDFVSAWFYLAAKHVANGGRAGFVSTSSITQGQQASLLWSRVNEHAHIQFAHQPFKWENGTGQGAAVSVIIAGLTATPTEPKLLWERGATEPRTVSSINGYLLAGEEVYVENRKTPLNSLMRPIIKGSNARDGGHLSNITREEVDRIRATDPVAAKYLRPLKGGAELTNGKERYCLWLVDASLAELNSSPVLRKVLGEVVEARQHIKGEQGDMLRGTPSLFATQVSSTEPFLMVPEVSISRRDYLPVGVVGAEVIPTHKTYVVENYNNLTFGVLQSRPFMLWFKTVGSRMNDDLSLSSQSTYNTFPLPELTDGQVAQVEKTAGQVLTVRDTYKGEALTHLYSPLTMPVDLRKAQSKLDDAILSVYGLNHTATDEEIVEALMRSYSALTA